MELNVSEHAAKTKDKITMSQQLFLASDRRCKVSQKAFVFVCWGGGLGVVERDMSVSVGF